jgi:hypothetical protein
VNQAPYNNNRCEYVLQCIIVTIICSVDLQLKMLKLSQIVFFLNLIRIISSNNDLSESCKISAKQKFVLKLRGNSKIALSIKRNGSEHTSPVIILSSENHGEWDRLAYALCVSGRHQIAAVEVKSHWKMQLWNVFHAIDVVQSYFGWSNAIIFAKADVAYMSLKYMQRNSSAVKKLGLFAPNITAKGDMWSQSKRRMDIGLFWCLNDEIIPFVPYASLWESSIEPPLLTTYACDPSTKFHRLPDQLIAGMVRFAGLEPLITESKISIRVQGNNS